MTLLEEINMLAKKKKEEGLTEEEENRRQQLHREYLKEFRAKFKTQLENVDVEYPDGSVKSLKDAMKKDE